MPHAKSGLAIIGLLVSMALPPSAARAQESAPAPEKQKDEPDVGDGTSTRDDDAAIPTLDRITVTARKREETLQDVPISVSAVSGTALEAQNLGEMETLSA